ncbi:MAG: hypothetical protein ABIL05_00750 [candidate division WOR-3 bacterium]
MNKRIYLLILLLAISVILNIYLLFFSTGHQGLLFAKDGGRDCLKQLNDRTYAENSTTEPLVGSPVQYFIFRDEKRNKIIYLFKYKDQITSEITDED